MRPLRALRGAAVAAPILAFAPLAAAPPAGAATGHGGWEPAPAAPFDRAAGVLCDGPVHAEPVRDEVERKVLATGTDGEPTREAYRGALVIRVTDTATGRHVDADAGGSAVVDHHPDGSTTWLVAGPVLVGMPEGGGSLPRGLYVIDGLYRMDISAGGYKDVHLAIGTARNLCPRLDAAAATPQ
jgi:hypothetical protein